MSLSCFSWFCAKEKSDAAYAELLVFEGMNEVSFSTSDAMTYNQKFVDTVRATGGNNADRLLICTADSNNTAKALSGQFSMPTDSPG